MALKDIPVLSAQNMNMPVIGLGTWQASDDETDLAIDTALGLGYRHIDTAFVYMNEAAIGRALKRWISSGRVTREDLFIVTKLPSIANRPEYVEEYLKVSLDALQLEYVDLYLIHNPVGLKHDKDNLFARNEKGELLLDMETDHIALYKAMEEQVDAGRTKAIGVSNFNTKQIKRIIDNCRIPPANVQVEMHVYHQQPELMSFCKENNVTVCAYAPLGSPALLTFTENLGFSTEGIPKLSPMTDPVVGEIAKKHGKSPSQVLLKFLIQLGAAVIPKSTNPNRIKQNFEVFDFELSPTEMTQLKSLDKGKAGRMFEQGIFEGAEKHPEYPFKD